MISRKRPSTVDVRLNTAQHPSVPSCHDRSIHLDERVLENLLIAEVRVLIVFCLSDEKMWSRKIWIFQENLKSNHLYFTAVQEHIEPIHREQAVEWIYDVAKVCLNGCYTNRHYNELWFYRRRSVMRTYFRWPSLSLIASFLCRTYSDKTFR